jgi:hypothetical protein
MAIREIAALMRRHLLAVLIVLIIAVGVVFDIKTTPTTYLETATVVFTAKNSLADPHSAGEFVVPLVATEVMTAENMMSAPEESQVRAAGGAASYDFVPLNLYSMQYPDYNEPAAILSATSQSPADVQRTFSVAVQVLERELAAIQARVPQASRIHIYLVGDSGLAAQPGSSTRVLAGLALLTIVAVFSVVNFLDRRRRRVRSALGVMPAVHQLAGDQG